jgi:hypothetical protein
MSDEKSDKVVVTGTEGTGPVEVAMDTGAGGEGTPPGKDSSAKVEESGSVEVVVSDYVSSVGGKTSFSWKDPVIYGGPTVGKTSLATWLRAHQVPVIDTDEVVKALDPAWYAEKKWRTATEEENQNLDHNVALAVSTLTRENPKGTVIVTNLWGSIFRNGIAEGGVIGKASKYSLGVIRSPEDVERESKLRGDGDGGIPAQLARKWMKAWLKWNSVAFDRVLTLPRGVYLADVWDLVAIGRRYDFTEVPSGASVRAYLQKINWKKTLVADDARVRKIRETLEKSSVDFK